MLGLTEDMKKGSVSPYYLFYFLLTCLIRTGGGRSASAVKSVASVRRQLREDRLN